MTAERLAIRACEERDLDQFGALGSERHREYCRGELARAERVRILVAVAGDSVVGKVHVRFDPGGTATLESAAVVPEHQRQGIGTALIEAAESLAAERGYTAVQLGVENRNPEARRLYERLGYRSVARMDFRYEDAPVPNPGVLMRKELA